MAGLDGRWKVKTRDGGACWLRIPSNIKCEYWFDDEDDKNLVSLSFVRGNKCVLNLLNYLIVLPSQTPTRKEYSRSLCEIQWYGYKSSLEVNTLVGFLQIVCNFQVEYIRLY